MATKARQRPPEDDAAEIEALDGVSPIDTALAADQQPAAPDDGADPAPDAGAVAVGQDVIPQQPILIPLRLLKLSADNVRRGGKAELEQLAADILAHGILQNLVGVLSADRETVEIIAGGRRLRALELLKRQKSIDVEYPVPVQLIEGLGAREASLAENFQRLPMGAGEEVEAFGKLAAAGISDADIAARFGLTVLHVRQRLRLAALHETVLKALKDRKITLEVAQAFASVADPARQAAVWKAISGDSWSRGNPNEIRRRMADKAARPGDVLARYVGEAAYVAAGGRTSVDLFAQGEAALWLDGHLVEQLARAKLVAAAEEIRVADGWGRVIPFLGWSEGFELRRDLVEYETGEEPAEIPADVRAGLVLLITLESDGTDGWAIEMDNVYLLDGAAPVPAPGGGAEEAEPDEEAEPAAEAAPEAEPDVEALKPLSGALQDALAMRRRDVLALALLRDPERARDLTMFLLLEEAGRSFAANNELGTCLQATSRDRGDPVVAGAEGLPWEGDTADALAIALADWQEFGSHREEGAAPIDDSWRHLKSAPDRWAAFIELPVEERLHWGAVALGRTLRPWGNNYNRTLPALQSAIASSLGLTGPAPDLWFPTAENYFDRAGKARCLQFLEEVFDGAVDAGGWGKWKKAELSSACAALAIGDASKLGALGGADPAPIIARARAWLPELMRFGKGVQ